MKRPKRDDASADIADVMREETHRGLRGRGVVDTATRKRLAREKAGLLSLLRGGASEDEISEVLTAALGLGPGTPEHDRALRRIRQYLRSRE